MFTNNSVMKKFLKLNIKLKTSKVLRKDTPLHPLKLSK